MNATFTEYQAASVNAPLPAPVIVSNSLLAVNGILLRYSGGSWLSNTNLMVTNPQPGCLQRYAYGPDYALQVVTDENGLASTAAALGYDPDLASATWNTQTATPVLPPATNSYDDFPAATGDYAVLGPGIYFRGVATDWTQVFSNQQQVIADIGSLSQGFDSQSLVNEGPNFLSYTVIPSDPDSPATVQSIVLQNAQVVGAAAVSSPSEKMYTEALEGPASPGMAPGGPDLFVTYTAASATFNSASAIYLHQYAGAAVAGALTHYAIYQLAVNDQYQDVSVTTYAPDPTQAACDSAGMVIKYYQTTVYPGAPDPANAAYGKTVNTYLNGLNVDGVNYYDMLDGLLIDTAIYDSSGNLLESLTSTWTVLNQVASDPVDADAAPIQLNGGWVACTGQTSFGDGVTTAKSTTFVPAGLVAPYTGRPASITSQSDNGEGATETWTRSFRYGVDVNPCLRALNMRSTQAQTTLLQQPASGGAVPVQSNASRFTTWPSGAGPGVMAPAPEATFRLLNASSADFPYDSYTPGSTPAGWLLNTRVIQRTVRGQAQQQVDACGTASSIIFSDDLRFLVAQISNAAIGAAAYLGFEPYESTSGWTLQNTEFETSDVRTGSTALQMPGGASPS